MTDEELKAKVKDELYGLDCEYEPHLEKAANRIMGIIYQIKIDMLEERRNSVEKDIKNMQAFLGKVVT